MCHVTNAQVGLDHAGRSKLNSVFRKLGRHIPTDSKEFCGDYAVADCSWIANALRHSPSTPLMFIKMLLRCDKRFDDGVSWPPPNFRNQSAIEGVLFTTQAGGNDAAPFANAIRNGMARLEAAFPGNIFWLPVVIS